MALRSAIAFIRYRLAFAEPRVMYFEVRDRSAIYADAFFDLEGKSYKVSEADSVPDWGHASPAAFLNGVGFVAARPILVCETLRQPASVYLHAGNLGAGVAAFCPRAAPS